MSFVFKFLILAPIDVLFMAEHYVGKLELPRTDVRVVQKGTGYFDLAKQIAAGRWLISGYKIIYISIGRS